MFSNIWLRKFFSWKYPWREKDFFYFLFSLLLMQTNGACLSPKDQTTPGYVKNTRRVSKHVNALLPHWRYQEYLCWKAKFRVVTSTHQSIALLSKLPFQNIVYVSIFLFHQRGSISFQKHILTRVSHMSELFIFILLIELTNKKNFWSGKLLTFYQENFQAFSIFQTPPSLSDVDWPWKKLI